MELIPWVAIAAFIGILSGMVYERVFRNRKRANYLKNLEKCTESGEYMGDFCRRVLLTRYSKHLSQEETANYQAEVLRYKLKT